MRELASIFAEFKRLGSEAAGRFAEMNSRVELEKLKASLVGPNGSFTLAVAGIGRLPKSARPEAGKAANALKQALQIALDDALKRIENQEICECLGEEIDPTLPISRLRGYAHPLSQTRDRVVEIFKRMGFSVADGSEVETEWFCFDALNMPKTHPARDSMDTFFLPEGAIMGNVSRHGDERFLLRTHTSTVQIRTLLRESLPLKIIAPGRVFRRDTVDATHSANFHQCEMLHVDRNLSVRDLKATVDFFLKSFFGEAAEGRLRPSFFPFTEPSFEVDVRVPNLGKLSNTWIEIFGCGMIDPEVFKFVNIDPDEWSGQAFGIGLERIAMLHYGIDDVRHFYRNDRRFIEQFNA